jgi:hypothetical protein
MKSQYTKGFEAGAAWSRKQLLEFLNAHHDLGDILTFDEIIEEVDKWETQDIEHLRGIADGRLARYDSVEECKGLCEDCFGTDLCLVCKGANK